MDCQFNNPVNLGGEMEDWEFSSASCTTDEILLVQNPSTGAEYYLDKHISYGDILTFIFLFLILLIVLFKGVWNFFFGNG
jgi:hypothetical protein